MVPIFEPPKIPPIRYRVIEIESGENTSDSKQSNDSSEDSSNDEDISHILNPYIPSVY